MNGDPRAIGELIDLIGMTSSKLASLNAATNEGSSLEIYEDLLLDELGHMQRLVLELTKLLTSDANEDESAFAEGELEDKEGDKT